MSDNVYFSQENRDIIDYTINRKKYLRNCDKTAFRALKDKILSYLSGEERKLIYMIYADNMTIKQIAERTGVSPAWVKKKISKLRKDIKQIADAVVFSDLSDLSREQREIFELRYCYRKDIQFIAAVLSKERHYVSNELKIIDTKLDAKAS